MKSTYFFLPLTVVLLTGCLSSRHVPTNSYTLTVLAPQAETPASFTVAIAPVDLPAYLDGRPMVKRSTESRLDISEVNVWAGGLREQFQRALVGNLRKLIGTGNVHPRTNTARFTVHVEVENFELYPDGQVRLNAVWTLTETKKDNAIRMREEVCVRPTATDYDGIAAAYSQAVMQFAVRVSDSVKKADN
ncbi:MAG: PqiC family protein [Lentisphaeria bacterium]|nr:PqiC family protein [Lentisphaeria bacterium]